MKALNRLQKRQKFFSDCLKIQPKSIKLQSKSPKNLTTYVKNMKLKDVGIATWHLLSTPSFLMEPVFDGFPSSIPCSWGWGGPA